MTINSNAPYYFLVAVKRIYPELPALIGTETWKGVQSQVDAFIIVLETQPNNYLAMTQLFGLLAQYEPARQRLTAEITVQKAISAEIAAPMERIAAQLGLDPDSVDGLTAAALAHFTWEVDLTTIPAPEDSSERTINMPQGGVGRTTSVKFKNMHLDAGDFATLAGGFITSATSIIDKPTAIVIIAGALLTYGALHNALKVELSEQEASVFWGITKTGKLKPTHADILQATNAERAKYDLEALTETQLRHSLTKLAQIKSVEKVDDTYRIIEDYHTEK